MKKDRLYLFTLAGITATVVVINILSVSRLIETSSSEILKMQIQSSAREAKEISRMLEIQLSSGAGQQEVAARLQKAIENMEMQNGFICMYNRAGVEICNPDTTRIGQVITASNSSIAPLNGGPVRNFSEVLQMGGPAGGFRDFFQEDRSEIIYVHPVKDTDWMVAAHANISDLNRRLSHIRINTILITALSSLVIIVLSFVVVRLLGSQYEKGIEREKESLITDLRHVTKMNTDLVHYKERIEDVLRNTQTVTSAAKQEKKRILTYFRDELVSVPVEEIAFINTKNSLSYIYCLNGKFYNSTASLDEIAESLDTRIFFRANRQFILSVRSIQKIFRYGNNQLKIVTAPVAEDDIIISKNKAAEFKDWLNS